MNRLSKKAEFTTVAGRVDKKQFGLYKDYYTYNWYLKAGEGEKLKDKVVIVTGANSGVGRETVRELAKKGATIVMACRNLEKSISVCQQIKNESKNSNIEVMKLDVGSMESVRDFVGRFSKKYNRVDVLINNAGTFSMEKQLTKEGLEQTMATNYFGPFLLTNLLLPLIKSTQKARIVNLFSKAAFHGQINLEDLNFSKRYHGFKAYSASKLGVVYFTKELAELLRDTGITVNAAHPGNVDSGMWKWDKWYMNLMTIPIKPFMVSPKEGAKTSIFLACSPEVEGVSGKLFDQSKILEEGKNCNDNNIQKRLWEISKEVTGIN